MKFVTFSLMFSFKAKSMVQVDNILTDIIGFDLLNLNRLDQRLKGQSEVTNTLHSFIICRKPDMVIYYFLFSVYT